jgi:hypothetical protein
MKINTLHEYLEATSFLDLFCDFYDFFDDETLKCFKEIYNACAEYDNNNLRDLRVVFPSFEIDSSKQSS